MWNADLVLEWLREGISLTGRIGDFTVSERCCWCEIDDVSPCFLPWNLFLRNLFSNVTIQGNTSFNHSSNEEFVCFCSGLSLCFTQVCVIILSCKQLQAYANRSQFTHYYLLWIVTPLGEVKLCKSVCFERKSRPQFEAGELLSVGFLNNKIVFKCFST